ncbi:hypothetical protein [Aminobacterium sp. UBA5514]|uniref:hypothetical protein n=1 Tax=Aminobacterium sp. UBA5514 TaxID=1946036 RepID=UPI002579F122|nr:hypothetical protein [Aminobacterium sp. UBA5514]
MAKYYVTCPVCGEEHRISLFGKISDREWKLEHWDWTCDECKKKRYDEENASAAEENKNAGLPALKGTERQIAWAETIRKQLIAAINTEREEKENPFKLDLSDPKSQQIFNATLKRIHQEACASWWIDNRDESPRSLIKNLAPKVYESGEWAVAEDNTKDLEEEAKREATVYPPEEKEKTRTVTEIRISGDEVQMIFPEKREDFRLFAREKGFRWKYSGKCWARKISAIGGVAPDFIAEIGNVLLADGFPICIFDSETREKALSGEFESEKTRWVKKKDENWFKILWGPNEDFYRTSRRIPGSVYDGESKKVIIPSSKYEEILDFAEQFDFTLSNGAIDLIEKAKKDYENAMVADVEKKKVELREPCEGAPFLPAPKDVEIDESLRDDN